MSRDILDKSCAATNEFLTGTDLVAEVDGNHIAIKRKPAAVKFEPAEMAGSVTPYLKTTGEENAN